MRKTLIIGIALSLVLVSGGLFSAQAGCGGGCLSSLSPCNWHISSLSPCNWNFSAISPCNWHFPSFCGFGCGSKDVNSTSARDADRPDATRQGAYYRATSPAQMGSPGI